MVPRIAIVGIGKEFLDFWAERRGEVKRRTTFPPDF
jgi:hypothetical protein